MILHVIKPMKTTWDTLGELLDRVTNGKRCNMVTIITEKLRNQTLEETVQFTPIPQTRRSWEVLTDSRISPSKGEWTDRKPNDAISQSSPLPTQAQQHSSIALLPTITTTTQSVCPIMTTWRTPQQKTADISHATQLCVTGSSCGDTQQAQTPQQHMTSTTTSCWQQYQTTNKNQQHMMQASVDNIPNDNAKLSNLTHGSFSSLFTSGTPPDPPKKRHCRSLSIPDNCKLGKQWQPQASSIWKPVALRTHHSSNKSHHSGSKLIKSRNSPLHLHHKPRLRSASPCSSNNNHSTFSNQGQNGARFSPAFGMFSGNDVYSTPPESPVPRPASASSGFYDSSASQTSLNISWTEGCFNSQNSFSPHPPRSKSASIGNFRNHRNDFQWERSLSVEEPISGQNSFGMQQTTGGNTICASNMSARSMPVINLVINSTPLSPRRNRVPRCRSQPCVLTDRKSGLKRRRGEERPSINFKKMAETAYSPCVPHTRPKSVTFAQDIQEILNIKSLSGGLYPAGHYHVLDPIASSPLDTPQVLLAAPHMQANIASSTTQLLVTKTAKAAIPTGASNTSEDVQWDSGCSDTNDPPDLISFGESENSCSFNDDPGTSTDVDVTDDNDDQQFQLEMSGEIDLDQIEKD